MNDKKTLWRCTGVMAGALLALAASAPASAVTVTWYVQGHMNAVTPDTPADLGSLAPAGAVFEGSFTFDTVISSSPIAIINGQRTDYVSNAAQGSTSLDVAGHHFGNTGSRIIEYADWNGQQLTLNGGAVTGPVPSAYNWGALDVLTLSHRGPGDASPTDKYPWFSLNGPQGQFKIIGSSTPPALRKGDASASMDLFFYSSVTSTFYHRQGTIEAIQTTPFAASVPEPATWGLMALGLVAVGLRRRRA